VGNAYFTTGVPHEALADLLAAIDAREVPDTDFEGFETPINAFRAQGWIRDVDRPRVAPTHGSVSRAGYSEPVPPLEDDVQTGTHHRHQEDREGIPEHPVQLRHPIEVHPIDRADQRRREQDGRPR
jgi:hypothetical protein